MLHTTPPCAHGFDQKYLAAPVSNLNLTCWDKTYLATSVLSRHLPGCPAAGSPSRPWPSWICFRFTLRFHSQVSHSQELPSLKDWRHTCQCFRWYIHDTTFKIIFTEKTHWKLLCLVLLFTNAFDTLIYYFFLTMSIMILNCNQSRNAEST